MANDQRCPECGLGSFLGRPMHTQGCSRIPPGDVIAPHPMCRCTTIPSLKGMHVPDCPASTFVSDPLTRCGCPECGRKILQGVLHVVGCSLDGLHVGALRALAEINEAVILGMDDDDAPADTAY